MPLEAQRSAILDLWVAELGGRGDSRACLMPSGTPSRFFFLLPSTSKVELTCRRCGRRLEAVAERGQDKPRLEHVTRLIDVPGLLADLDGFHWTSEGNVQLDPLDKARADPSQKDLLPPSNVPPRRSHKTQGSDCAAQSYP
jgi:hypothetical protein